MKLYPRSNSQMLVSHCQGTESVPKKLHVSFAMEEEALQNFIIRLLSVLPGC
jgi:hypothetical protein